MSYTNKQKNTGTKHNDECTMAFGKPTKTHGVCPRCDELRNGASPRKGWNSDKINQEQQFKASLKEHDCKTRGCGPVCTFGDY